MNLHIAPDADGEPTVWNHDTALLRRCELDDILLWGLVCAGVENFNAVDRAERLEQEAIRTVALLLEVAGGRVMVTDEATEALPRDAEVARWRDEQARATIYQLVKHEPLAQAPPAVHDALQAEWPAVYAQQLVDEAQIAPEDPPGGGNTA